MRLLDFFVGTSCFLRGWRKSFFRGTFFSLVLLGVASNAFAEELPPKEFVTEEMPFEFVETSTTWNTKFGSDPVKEIVIVEPDVTLTIEAGTTVEVLGIVVYGTLKAEGTKSNPILFSPAEIEASLLPENIDAYDEECFVLPWQGMIQIGGATSQTDQEPSVFYNTVFSQMGKEVHKESPDCPYSSGDQEAERGGDFAPPSKSIDIQNPALSFRSGNVLVESALFSQSEYADIAVGALVGSDTEDVSRLLVEKTDFLGNSGVPALQTYEEVPEEDETHEIILDNNWYGHSSGPETAENPEGEGIEVLGVFDLRGWSEKPYRETVSNVLFLPGIKASKLYTTTEKEDKETEDQIWPPTLWSDDIDQLMLDEQGESVEAVYTKDVLATVSGMGDLYQTFLGNLDEMKTKKEMISWESFAYDWRYDVSDIVRSGVAYPQEEIRSLILLA